MPKNNVYKKKLPDQALLLDLLKYDPLTGLLTWRSRDSSHFDPKIMCPQVCAKRWNTKNAGNEITSFDCGYRFLSVFGSKYLAHRIIWKMVHGTEPVEIDHIDHCRGNNKLENLRNLTDSPHLFNARNMKMFSTNSSGFTGVYWLESRSRWIAEILVLGKKVRLGSFTVIDDAIAARKAGNKKYGFHENHGMAA